jgi:hypothetical protein
MIRLRSLLALMTRRSEHPTGHSKRPTPFRPTLQALETRDAPSGLGHTTEYSGFLTDSGRYGDGGAFIYDKGHHVIWVAGN